MGINRIPLGPGIVGVRAELSGPLTDRAERNIKIVSGF